MPHRSPRTRLPCAGVSCVLLSGCLQAPPGSTGTDSDFYDGPTQIEALSVSCSAADDLWTVQVDTAGWTAGGIFAWTADGLYIEEHDLYSDEADFYGAWDLLLAELAVSADPQAASRNSSTALLCDPPTREGLRGWLSIYDPETEEPVDCRIWGEDFDWELAGYAPCDRYEDIRLR